jgi:molecular chaperone DnaK
MYRGGCYAIPSILAVDPEGVLLVGEEARAQAQRDPRSAVLSPKRILGGSLKSPETDAIRRLFTHSMVEDENGEIRLAFGGKIFDLTEVSARILMKIREIAEDCLGEEVGAAVITVPAYFNAKQRHAIRQAGTQAGLDVLRILNEPTAAALAYGLGRDLRQRLAVFDLGGGTLDLSIITIRDRVFEVVASGGDAFLGGLDFDDRIIRYALDHFKLETGIDLSEDDVAVQRIREAAEHAKIALSTASTTQIEVPFLARGPSGVLGLDMSLSRAELEDLTSDLVDRAIEKTRALFEEAGIDLGAIDEVLLVGGQSRMPLVHSKVTELFGRSPCSGVHPDEAVAVGASIMAHSLAQLGTGPTISLLDALPQAIGIAQVDSSFLPIFPAGCPLPHVRRLTLTNSEADQTTIMLKLFRGSAERAEDNELLGDFVFSGFVPQDRGTVKLQVWLTIDIDGQLSVRATERGTTLPMRVGLKGPGGLLEPVLSLTTESRRGELLRPTSEPASRPILFEASAPLPEPAPAAAPRPPAETPPSPSPTPPVEAPAAATPPVEAPAAATPSPPQDTAPQVADTPAAPQAAEQPESPDSTEDAERAPTKVAEGAAPLQATEPAIATVEEAATDSEDQEEEDEDDQEALLEQLVNATRPMETMDPWDEASISPAEELGSVWDESRNRASAGAEGAAAAAESLEGDEDIAWFELFLPWNWWK